MSVKFTPTQNKASNYRFWAFGTEIDTKKVTAF